MTKEIFSKSVSKVIPIIGGVTSGGLTYITLKPMANKLKDHLCHLQWSDPNYYADICSVQIEVKQKKL